MNVYLKCVPRATSLILFLSLAVPLAIKSFPCFGRMLSLQKNLLLPLSAFFCIFAASFDVPLLMNCLMRYQILRSIERAESDEEEILFYTALFIFSLGLSNLTESLQSFHESVNVAYVFMLSSKQATFNIFGADLPNHLAPYVYAGADLLLSGGRTKSYYGLLHGLVYIHLKQHGLGTPAWFSRFYRAARDGASVQGWWRWRRRGRKIRSR